MSISAMIALVLGLAFGVAEAQPKEGPTGLAIEYGSKVQLEYTLTDDGGTVLDSNKGGEPLRFSQGEQ